MGYTRVNWEDAPSEKTPLTAENLNIMDAGIKTLDEEKLGLEGDASGTTVEFEESSELTAVTSKSTLKTLFGIVAKAVSSLISHVSNTTLHITAAERTAWNGKANVSHTHAASQIGDGTLGGAVVANASAVANIGTKQLRNIYAGTTEMVAGTSALTAGDIYVKLKV